jgi:hypothetical protein
VLVSDEFTEGEREYVAALRVRSLYAATIPDAVHAPARRPSTGEVPGLRAMATAHLAAGLRDSRRILNEALAQCTQLEAFLEVRARFVLDAALRPGMTEDDVMLECLVMLHGGAHGLLTPAAARELCVAMLEGWCHRQRLDARRPA